MLCLHDTIHDDDPAVQRFLSAVEDAHSLTVFILAAWQVARVLTIHLNEAVCWLNGASTQHTGPAARSVGQACAVKALQSARLPASGPIQWRRRVGRCPHGCETPRWPP